MPGDETNGRDGDSGGIDLAGIPSQSILTTLSGTACPRGGVSVTYGPDLYLSDVSDDELGTALASNKRRSGHIRAPTFADHVMVIQYDVDEKVLIDKQCDVISNKLVALGVAVLIEYEE